MAPTWQWCCTVLRGEAAGKGWYGLVCLCIGTLVQLLPWPHGHKARIAQGMPKCVFTKMAILASHWPAPC